MEWITSIIGMISGGWGTFASIVAGLIALIVLYKKYKAYKIKKAKEEGGIQGVKDEQNLIKNNQNSSGQIKSDLQKAKDLLEEQKGGK